MANLVQDTDYTHDAAQSFQNDCGVDNDVHNAALELMWSYHEHMNRFIPANEWHDDDGDVLWYRLPVAEPPYVGSPLDTDWHDEPFAILLNGETKAEYFTHFQYIHTPEH